VPSYLLLPAWGNVEIFFDQQMEAGISWPNELAHALSHSRVLIPILSRAYFKSPWCKLELDLMLRREQLLGLRSRDHSRGLIVPFIIDDGDEFPQIVKDIQGVKIHEYANPYIRRSSSKYHKFTEDLRKWCVHVDSAYKLAPKFDPAWKEFPQDKLMHLLDIEAKDQETNPRHFSHQAKVAP